MEAQRKGQRLALPEEPVSAEQMETSRLRAELAQMRMEHDILRKGGGVLRQGSEVKHAFIRDHRQEWPIRIQCSVLDVSVPGCYGHWTRLQRMEVRRHRSDETLVIHIRAVHQAYRGA